MLILSRGITRESVGRLYADIDSTKKIVTLKSKDGTALESSELTMMKKFLRYHHPEIINKSGILTGWSIVGELEIPLT